MIRICVVCNTEFETKHSQQKTCSKKCSQRNHYLNEVKRAKQESPYRTCKICDAQFIPEGKEQFCSEECSKMSRTLSKEKLRDKKYASGKIKKREPLKEESQEIVTHICTLCGKEFSGRKKKYCSAKCAKDAVKRYQIEYHKNVSQTRRKRKIQSKPLRVCKICGKEFTVDQHHRSYCSKECYTISCQKLRLDFYQAVREKNYTTCAVCGKQFLITRYNIKYCSDQCREASKKSPD